MPTAPLTPALVPAATALLGRSPVSTAEYADFLDRAGDVRWVLLRPDPSAFSRYQPVLGTSPDDVFGKAGLGEFRRFHMNHAFGDVFSINHAHAFALRPMGKIPFASVADAPMFGLTWFEAMAFCLEAGGSLPSASEYASAGSALYAGSAHTFDEWLLDPAYGDRMRRLANPDARALGNEDLSFCFTSRRAFRLALPSPEAPNVVRIREDAPHAVKPTLSGLIKAAAARRELTQEGMYRLWQTRAGTSSFRTFCRWWSGESVQIRGKNHRLMTDFLRDLGASEEDLRAVLC